MATKCPVTRAEFKEGAKPLTLEINGTKLMADPKDFSTGSFGWYLSGKVTVDVAGKPVTVQVSANLTVVGSKELPKE